MVRKIAGNTEANPANSGWPCDPNHTAKPIANPAAKPRESKTGILTLFLPRGAALSEKHTKIDNDMRIIIETKAEA